MLEAGRNIEAEQSWLTQENEKAPERLKDKSIDVLVVFGAGIRSDQTFERMGLEPPDESFPGKSRWRKHHKLYQQKTGGKCPTR